MEHKVLIVDDNEDHLSTVASIVERHFPVLTAASGEEAIAIMEAEIALRAVLTDFAMRVLTGADVLRRTREVHPQAHRVLMSSKLGTEEGFEERIATDCEPHILLPKPMSLQKLRQVVATWQELS